MKRISDGASLVEKLMQLDQPKPERKKPKGLQSILGFGLLVGIGAAIYKLHQAIKNWSAEAEKDTQEIPEGNDLVNVSPIESTKELQTIPKVEIPRFDSVSEPQEPKQPKQATPDKEQPKKVSRFPPKTYWRKPSIEPETEKAIQLRLGNSAADFLKHAKTVPNASVLKYMPNMYHSHPELVPKSDTTFAQTISLIRPQAVSAQIIPLSVTPTQGKSPELKKRAQIEYVVPESAPSNPEWSPMMAQVPQEQPVMLPTRRNGKILQFPA